MIIKHALRNPPPVSHPPLAWPRNRPLSNVQALLAGAQPRHSYTFGQWLMDGPQFPQFPVTAGSTVSSWPRMDRAAANVTVGIAAKAEAVAALAFYTRHLGSGNVSAIPALALSPCDPFQDGRPDPQCPVGCKLCPGSPGKRKQLLNVTAACAPSVHGGAGDMHVALCSGPGVIEHLDAGYLGFVHFRGVGRFGCPDGLSPEACDAIFVPDLHGLDNPRRPSLTFRLPGPAYFYNGTRLDAAHESIDFRPANKRRRRRRRN